MIADARLDHVAVAAVRHELLLDRYVAQLGGRFVGFGEGVGFSPLQVRYRNGAKVELLRPHLVEVNDFLARFLDQRGPGPHHLTFKVPDIEAAIGECTSAGFPVVNVDLSYDDWKEAFVHPKTAHGVLVQLAQAAGDMPGEPPAWFPEPGPDQAALLRVVHAVASLDEARALFSGVLGGRSVDHGDDEGAWDELAWGDGLHVRLWTPSDPSVLGGANGRVHHLVFEVAGADPHTVPAVDNHGVELRVVAG